MKCYFSRQGGLGRESVLGALKGALDGVVGASVRLHPERFLDSPLADFFASDADQRLYAIRWIDAASLASDVFDTLSAYARHAAGRTDIGRALNFPADGPPMTLVLVTDTAEADLVQIASMLNFPIYVVRAHALVDGQGGLAGCYFETCFPGAGSEVPRGDVALANGAVPQGHKEASLRDSGTPAEASRKPREHVSEPIESQMDRSTGAREDSETLTSSESMHEGLDWDSPAEVLSEEEAATFRLLENALASGN